MDTAAFKVCPFCSEQIRKEAVKCRFCGEWLEEAYEPKANSISDEKAKPQPGVFAPNREMTSQSEVIGTAANTTEAPVSGTSAARLGAPSVRPNGFHPRSKPLIPLFLIALWVFCYVTPLAIKNGASDVLGIVLATLSYCTTPGSLLVLSILAIWFWSSRRKSLSSQTAGETSKQYPRRVWLIIAAGLCVSGLAYVSIRAALASRTGIQRQKLVASGVSPDALKGWEILKGDKQLSDTTGLTPAAKKRLRESFALQLRGTLGAFTNLTVDLQGDDHDKLIVASSNMDPSAIDWHQVLQQADADFWNRMRLLDFDEIVFTGMNHSEAITKSKFTEWSRGYGTYVSNMLSMYQGQLFEVGGGNELDPAMQKTMRRNLASELDGGLKSIYKSLEVKLEGDNEDKLVLHLREMDAPVADDLLNTLRKGKTGNFWNGLRALGFSELILSGDDYHNSIPRTEFIQWCRDYEKYLADLHQMVGQISGGLSREATNSGR